MRSFALVAAVAVLFEPGTSQARAHPTDPPKHAFPKLGTCYVTRITAVEGRLGSKPTDSSGSQVEFANGVFQVSYGTVRGIVHSRVGDKVTMCVVELPADCPPGDFRGVFYRTHDWRTKETWTVQNSEHGCGGG